MEGKFFGTTSMRRFRKTKLIENIYTKFRLRENRYRKFQLSRIISFININTSYKNKFHRTFSLNVSSENY